MHYPRFTAARRHLIPLTALLLATALGGCVGYTAYPSGYGYNYPATYPNSPPGGYYGGYPSAYSYNYANTPYAGYPQTYNNSNTYRPFYTPNYNGTFNTYTTSGSGN
jgi:hypothetical protein